MTDPKSLPDAVERVDTAELRKLLERLSDSADVLESCGYEAIPQDLRAAIAQLDKLETENERKDKMLNGCEATIARERGWRQTAEASNASLVGALEPMLFDVGGSPDHMTACERTMGATHPCTCGADRARQALSTLSGEAAADNNRPPVEPARERTLSESERHELECLRARVQQIEYPCSPHCDGYLRELSLRNSAAVERSGIAYAVASLRFDLRRVIEFGPEYNQAVKDALDRLASLPAEDNNRKGAETEVDRHRFGSPPEPVVNPNEKWCDAYADWYYQGSR